MKILHLYHDLMNLYGDYANLSALCRILEQNGVDCTVDRLSLGDTPVLSDYDFIYIGSGSEENMRLALSHLSSFKNELKDYIEKGGFALLTGNSFEMLGESINGPWGDVKGLGICDFTVTQQDTVRTTSDAIFLSEEVEQPLVGFVNKCSEIYGVKAPLFTVEMGLGNTKTEKGEGIRVNNFFGTHLTGPLLVKNPHFLEFLASSLCRKPMDSSAFVYEKAAYNITLEKLRDRI